jgi:predicted alpha/beta-fold hydrolase
MDSLEPRGMKAVTAADFPPFRERLPWWGGDLQTLHHFLTRHGPRLDAPERIMLATRDGSGDRLVGSLHRARTADARRRPLAVLLHGLGGSEDSPHLRTTAEHLLASGFPVLRLNFRGAGPSRPFCRFQYHAGATEDLGDALSALPPDLTTAGIVAIGFSLGASILLNFLGQYGASAPLKAAVAISAPLDLAAAARQLMRPRNIVYQRYLLRRMRSEILAPGAELTAAERRAIRSARSIWEFDDRFSAPRNGFGSARDYYEVNAPWRYLDGIAVPTLVIHALDDPWIPATPYLTYDWQRNSSLMPLLPANGGHMGFQGGARSVSWHDLCAARFLAAL